MKKLMIAVGMLCCAVAFADNAALIKQLGEGPAEARDAARRELLEKAGPQDIPALAPLLQNAETFDAAWFLLEAVGGPEADKARWGALEKADAPEHFRKAMWAYAIHSLSTSTDVAKLKETALHNNAPEDLRVRAVERLEALKETKAAVALYTQLKDYAGFCEHTRLAMLCGLIRTDTANQAKWLEEGLCRGSEAQCRTVARLAAGMPEAALKKPLAAIEANLPKSLPVWRILMSALADAENPMALPMVRKALKSSHSRPDAEDSVVMVKMLGVLGTADDVDTLVDSMESDDEEMAQSARVSLGKLKDPKTNAKIARAIPKQKNARVTAELVAVLAIRGGADETETFVKALGHDAPEVRTVAFRALAAFPFEKYVKAITVAAAKAADEAERQAAERTMLVLAEKYPQTTIEAIGKSFKDATPPMKSAFLKAAASTETPAALALVRSALKDTDASVADDAARVLANWKDDVVAPDLLQVADTHKNNSIRVLALRGYIRLIAEDKDAASRERRCTEAAKRVSRPEEKLLLAEALGTVPTQWAIDQLKPWLADEALKRDATKALRRIARTMPVDVPDVAPGSWIGPVAFVAKRVSEHRSESCVVADFTGDGKLDIAAGPFLYVAPDWTPVQIRDVKSDVKEDGKGYADDFFNLALDVNGDGKLDILSGGWFSQTSYWFENTHGKDGLWPTHEIDKLGNHETGTLEDVTGSGKADCLVPQSHITVWYERAEGGMKRHNVSGKGMALGAGVGDINGDGRPDILRPNAWFEAPEDIRNGTWAEHPLALGAPDNGIDHTSNIIVFDVNKDGLPDLIASSAHKHGIWWYEQKRGADGKISWVQHLIDNTWTQAHYLLFADIDNDGVPEIITGKRFMAHNGGDPDAFGKLCVCYYRFTPGPAPAFRKHVVSYDQGFGAGMSIIAADLDGDGALDLITTGKWGGPVIFENQLNK